MLGLLAVAAALQVVEARIDDSRSALRGSHSQPALAVAQAASRRRDRRGGAIALLARLAGLSPALVGCAALFAAATALIAPLARLAGYGGSRATRLAGYGALQSGPSNVNVAADPSDPTAR